MKVIEILILKFRRRLKKMIKSLSRMKMS